MDQLKAAFFAMPEQYVAAQVGMKISRAPLTFRISPVI